MRIIIATGGSGGHIYPALALADEIKKEIDSEILFIGSNNKMEQVEIPSHGYAFKGINVQGMNGGIKDKIIALYKLFKANKICNNIIEEFKPDIVIRNRWIYMWCYNFSSTQIKNTNIVTRK